MTEWASESATGKYQAKILPQMGNGDADLKLPAAEILKGIISRLGSGSKDVFQKKRVLVSEAANPGWEDLDDPDALRLAALLAQIQQLEGMLDTERDFSARLRREVVENKQAVLDLEALCADFQASNRELNEGAVEMGYIIQEQQKMARAVKVRCSEILWLRRPREMVARMLLAWNCWMRQQRADSICRSAVERIFFWRALGLLFSAWSRALTRTKERAAATVKTVLLSDQRLVAERQGKQVSILWQRRVGCSAFSSWRLETARRRWEAKTLWSRSLHHFCLVIFHEWARLLDISKRCVMLILSSLSTRLRHVVLSWSWATHAMMRCDVLVARSASRCLLGFFRRWAWIKGVLNRVDTLVTRQNSSRVCRLVRHGLGAWSLHTRRMQTAREFSFKAWRAVQGATVARAFLAWLRMREVHFASRASRVWTCMRTWVGISRRACLVLHLTLWLAGRRGLRMLQSACKLWECFVMMKGWRMQQVSASRRRFYWRLQRTFLHLWSSASARSDAVAMRKLTVTRGQGCGELALMRKIWCLLQRHARESHVPSWWKDMARRRVQYLSVAGVFWKWTVHVRTEAWLYHIGARMKGKMLQSICKTVVALWRSKALVWSSMRQALRRLVKGRDRMKSVAVLRSWKKALLAGKKLRHAGWFVEATCSTSKCINVLRRWVMRVVENKGMREALRLVRMHAVRNGMQIFWGAWRQITAACHVLRLGGLRAFLVAVVRRWGLFTRCARNRRVAGGLLGRLQWIFQAALGRSSLRKWARIASESVWLRRSVCRFVNRRVTIALRKILACWRSIVVVAARSRLIFTYLRGMVRRGILRGILFFWRQRIFLRRTCCSFNSKARRCMLRMTIRSWQKASSRVRTLLALELHAHRRCGLSCLIIWRLFCAVQRCAVANARTLKTSWLKWFRRVARQRVRMALALRFDRARARRLHQWVFIGFVQSKAFADRRRRNERMCSAREWESREGTRRAALIVWSAVVLVGQGPKAKASSSGKAELVEKVGEGGWGEAEKRMRQALVVASVALREASCRRKSPGMRHAKDGTRSFLEDPWHEQPMQTPPRSITS